jgi:hypothetical protein
MADEDATDIELRQPTQCTLWENPVLAHKLSEAFELVEEYDDDRHQGRSLRKCRECGQLYFREWHEWIDWEGGNDKTYITLIPVQTPEEIAALKETDIFSLLRYRPRLQLDDGSNPIWIGKD